MRDTLSSEIEHTRQPDYPIHPMILNRWSPRSMTGEPLSDTELFPLFEAARWAPSSYNDQPWGILYVKRNHPDWEKLFCLLVDFNRQWCIQAAVLGLFFSRTTRKKSNQRSRTHAFDAGAAWENLCLQGVSQGLVVHGMEGFNYEQAQLLIPREHVVHAMFAIGRRGAKSALSQELQQKETPSTRKKISEFAFEGIMTGN